MTIGAIRTEWNGTSGGPGLTQIFFAANPATTITAAEAQTAVNAMRAFWDVVDTYLPNELTLLVSPVVDQYQETNGELVATVSAATAPAVVTGQSATAYLGGAGGKVTWNTNAIANGRRVRGHTYIVPMAANAADGDGTMIAAAISAINGACTTFINTLVTADLFPVVWSRPLKDADGNITRNGTRTDIVTGALNEKSAILRGRRD